MRWDGMSLLMIFIIYLLLLIIYLFILLFLLFFILLLLFFVFVVFLLVILGNFFLALSSYDTVGIVSEVGVADTSLIVIAVIKGVSSWECHQVTRVGFNSLSEVLSMHS